VGYAQTEAVSILGEGDAIIGPGKDFAEQTEGGSVIVVHHLEAQAPAPCLFRGDHLLREGDG
jgi:hypothetical protein